jgi:nicotinate-nucleotide adenylyltransferase
VEETGGAQGVHVGGALLIGILGGTLDPIHCGHLAAAAAARDALDLPRVLVLPSRIPPHRSVQPSASPFHRFAMAALAVSGMPRLEASDDELRTEGPSYTADTLERQHAAGTPAARIFFITGADAFADIATWKRYPDVLELANFVVVTRPGHPIASLAERLPHLAGRMRPASAARQPSATPSIYLLQAPTPDVSSTMVRDRLRRGEAISGLVPPLVEAHIRQHRLYAPVPAAAPAGTRADHLHGQD